ncbi:MAG: Trm112 family protein [Pseudomonadota bacterium]
MTGEDGTGTGGDGVGGGGEPPPERPARRMMEALVCPLTGAALRWDPSTEELVSRAAGLAYPIRSGIPIMLVDEARKLDE